MNCIIKKIYRDNNADEIIIFSPSGAKSIYKDFESIDWPSDFVIANQQYLASPLAIGDNSSEGGNVYFYKEGYTIGVETFIQEALIYAPEAFLFNFNEII